MIKKYNLILLGLIILTSCKNQANSSNKEKVQDDISTSLSSSGIPKVINSKSSANPAGSAKSESNSGSSSITSANPSSSATANALKPVVNTIVTNSVSASVNTQPSIVSSQKMDTSLIGDSFDMANPNSLKFENIAELTMDADTNNVYILNGKKINKLSIVDHKNVLINKNDTADSDPNIKYVGIEVDQRNHTVSTIEYRNSGTFYGVKRFFPDGHFDYPVKSTTFDSLKLPTVTGSGVKHYEFDGYKADSLALNRLKKGLYLKFKTNDNAYFWIDLSDLNMIDVWRFYCLRTDKCDGSANLMDLMMTVQFQSKPNYDTDSNGNIYTSNNNCQLNITSKANGGTIILGEKCNVK